MPRATRAAARAGLVHIDDPNTGIEQMETPQSERPPLGEIPDNDRKLALAFPDPKIKSPKKKGKAKNKNTETEKDEQKVHQDTIVEGIQYQGGVTSEVIINDTHETEELSASSDEHRPGTERNREQPETGMPSNVSAFPKSQTLLVGEHPIDSHMDPSQNDSSKTDTRWEEDTILQTIPPIEFGNDKGKAQDASQDQKNLSSTNKELPAIREVSTVEISKKENEPIREPSVAENNVDLSKDTATTQTSPSQYRKRPEDSIEAIDALEDVLEEIDKELSVLDDPEHPKNDHDSDKGSNFMRKTSTGPTAKCVSRSHTVKLKPAGPKLSTTRHTKAASMQETRSIQRSSTSLNVDANTTADARANHGSGNQANSSKRRPVSLSFPTPPPPPKSRKPPTKPTFQLPGEAIAAKLKAQREERLKREQEDEQKKREFKARPIRKSVVPAISVKDTAASRARKSLLHPQAENPTNNEDKRTSLAPRPRSARKSSSDTKSNSTTTSTIQKPPQPSAPTSKPRLSTTDPHRPRNPPSSRTTSTSSTTTTTTTATTHPRPSFTKPAITPSDLHQQRRRARASFARDRQADDAREAARREQENAARRARAEAAERGRAASREWAGRQREKVEMMKRKKQQGVQEGEGEEVVTGREGLREV
ncbi:MAG: hypothetical protein M1821_006258 [Bathelium mastoideum]|nr:MAG: hypothetical protein M1821_006258 [Bathelium mastoideum]KAI9686599.1 MAG: hypothetical protein M1822_003610 [Bathelium mastoideum]